MSDQRNSLETLGEELGRAALAAFGLPCPVDLLALASALGVQAVGVDRELHEDGRTTWTETAPTITLRDDPAAGGRARFTFAHELAHVIVGNAGQPGAVSRRTLRLRPQAEETLCDAVAAALLLPREWVAARLEVPAQLGAIRRLAAAGDVSLAAAAVRVGAVFPGHDLTLLRWRKAGSRWALAGRAGWPMQMGYTVRAGSGTEALLEAGRGTGVASLFTEDGEVRVTAEADRRGATSQLLMARADLLTATRGNTS